MHSKTIRGTSDMFVAELQSAKTQIPKSQNGTLNGTLNCNLDELALLLYVKENLSATQIENGKRNGKWVVKCKI